MATTISDYTNLAIKGLQEPFRLAVQNRLEKYMELEFINFGSSTEYDKIYSSSARRLLPHCHGWHALKRPLQDIRSEAARKRSLHSPI